MYDDQGLFGGEIHRFAHTLFDETLPCQEGGKCPFYEERDFDPDDYDVLIGYYTHAHSSKSPYGTDITKDRFVAIDEFPDGAFLKTFDTGTVTKAVNALLGDCDDSPYQFKKELTKQRTDTTLREAGTEWLTEILAERDVVQVVEDMAGGAHVDAATIAYVVLNATELENGWEYATLPNGQVGAINPTDESVTILTRPDIGDAKGVIALDGTPTVELWRLLLGESLTHEAIHSDEEKGEYLEEGLGIRVVRTSENVKPYSSGIHVTPPKDIALIEGVGLIEEELPSLISSRRAINQYKKLGLADLVDDWTHYGATKGINNFGKKRVGIVVGSPHYGDQELQKWGALAGKSLSRAEDQYGSNVDFGDYGNKLLYGMREQAVLQALMRFGRDGGGATVYVHTSALPEWVRYKAVSPQVHTWVGEKEGMKKVIAAIDELEEREWRCSQIVDAVPLSPQQVRTHLNRLEEFGFLKSRRGSGRGRPYIWSDHGIDSIGDWGHVNFDV
ncbi:helix-turn-helix domain-containing protein [Halorubellus litoreus]|uniref:Helix-turn-helix domain-containing protein n=1 Tax=Halorubellus litoreus TaxID=755308 RepID=A0ABD5VJF5_9EURY